MKSPDEYTVNVESSRGTKEFQFDAIFMEDSTQEKIFEDTNVNILTNVHVFASSFLFQNYYDLLTKLKMSLNKKTFHFSYYQLFFRALQNLIQSAMDGYNVCIFAYGQTGSGKTFTMIGDRDQRFPGVAPRSFDRIFSLAHEIK